MNSAIYQVVLLSPVVRRSLFLRHLLKGIETGDYDRSITSDGIAMIHEMNFSYFCTSGFGKCNENCLRCIVLMEEKLLREELWASRKEALFVSLSGSQSLGSIERNNFLARFRFMGFNELVRQIISFL